MKKAFIKDKLLLLKINNLINCKCFFNGKLLLTVNNSINAKCFYER